MNRKTLTAANFLAVCLLVSTALRAQNFNDIVNYSTPMPQGSARSVALSNAMGAIGTDFTTLATNPAGLALYRKGEIAMSGSLGVMSNRDNYLGSTTTSSILTSGFDGVGAIVSFVSHAEKQSGLIALNMGISYSKLKDFNGKYVTSGNNPDHSFTDRLALQANDQGIRPENLLNDAAWDAYDWYITSAYKAYLLEPDGPLDAQGKVIFDHFITTLQNGEAVQQKQTTSSKGSLSELDFSLGFNLSNRFYLGATLGLQLLSRNWTSTLAEQTLLTGKTEGFESLSFVERNRDNGVGVNCKIGFIARPVDMLRIGVALHTPTAMSVNTRFTLDAYGNFYDDPKKTEGNSPKGKATYSFTGPLTAMGSVALFMGKIGCLSADYLYTHFPLARFNDGARYEADNEIINHQLKGVHEVRLGSEILLGYFAVRLGGGFQTSPYSRDLWEPYGMRYYASAGMGFSMGTFYVDLAYRHHFQKAETTMYAYRDMQPSYTRLTQRGNVFITAGFRF